MWNQVVRARVILPNTRTVIRRFASDSVRLSSESSITAKLGRDIPLIAVPRDVRQATRRAQRRATSGGTSDAVVRTTSLPTKISIGLLVSSITGSIVWHFLLDNEIKSSIKSTLSSTILGDLYDFLAAKIEEAAKPYTDPSRAKLLPDWPIPEVAPDTPPVPVLVLDLEDTLVHSEWSRKHGWRHAKRPGVDEFLESLAQYYEIVVFSHNNLFSAEEIVMKLDKKRCILHILGVESTRYYQNMHVKDLSNLNRDLRQVVVIDDDPIAYQLQPENAIPIKPYTDGKDREDRALKDLIPFLKALATERVGDFRNVLSEFRDEDGIIRDLPSKYQARVQALEKQKEQDKQKGLGGFIRGRGRLSTRPSNLPSVAL